jgi:5S rRNA maturation endonuclease (ribonuclease M5)
MTDRNQHDPGREEESILDRVLDRLEGVRPRRGGYRALCPAHADRNPSLSISEGDDGRVLLYCHAGCSPEAVLGSIGLDWSDLFANETAHAVEPEAVYEYMDAAGLLLFEVVRFPEKRFAQRRPDPERPGSYLRNRDGVEPVLYRLPELLAAVDAGRTVYVVEGEKDVEALARLGVTATCNPGGAGKWRAEYAEALRGATVIVVADRDEPGRQHAAQVARTLHGWAESVAIVEPAEGKDAADHVEAGHELSDFRSTNSAAAQELSPLLDEIVAYMLRFIVLSGVQADAIALWVVHTHVFVAADATPYVQVTSAEKRSGKSRLLDVLEPLVREPMKVISPTEAVLFRMIDATRPTVLIDEYDTIFKNKDYEGLRAILNAGFQPGTLVPRLLPVGNSFQLQTFDVFSPKALAGIGELPETISDRSIRIELKRRAPGETVEKARRRTLKEAARPIHARLEQAAPAWVTTLSGAEPAIPDELDDRAADIWEPLIAIADFAGHGWSDRARLAAIELAAGESREEESRGLKLLRDIALIFAAPPLERISTTDLIRQLAEDQESPWADWWDTRENQPAKGAHQQLARLLKPYSIRSHNTRIEQQQLKGFARNDFTDAWNRYLPQEAPQPVPTVPTTNGTPGNETDGTDGTANTSPGEDDPLDSVWD